MQLFVLLYFVGFLRTLIIILAVFYGFRFLMRWLAPKVVDKAAQKLYDDMKKKSGRPANDEKKEGEVTIEYSERHDKKFNRSDGEYIDFEEVD